MSIKVVKIVSACLAVAGAGISLAANAVSDKLLDDKINTKVTEALSKSNN